jgi:DNA-binding NarL/FixJ family response regulator
MRELRVTFVRGSCTELVVDGMDAVSIRICIADDHLLIITGIRKALQEAEELEVVGVTQRGDEVLALVDEHRPDVVLLDHRMPGMDGLAVLKLLREQHPDVKVVMLSANENTAHVNEALALGASAYIGKRINPRDLASALRQIVDGVVYHTGPGVPEAGEPAPQAPSEPAAQTPGSDLTQKELTILEAIARGLSTKAISREQWITEKTVKFHLTNIYRKLGVNNRTGAMRCAYEHDLIPKPRADGGAASTA